MRIVFAVFILLLAYVASYPSFREDETENDLELELRSILKHLDEEQMTRSLTNEDNEDEDVDDENYAVSKRQGGNNVIDKQSSCEIKCIHTERFPKTGKGKTVKDAAKACKTKCPVSTKRRGDKKTIGQKQAQRNDKLNLREFVDDDDSNSNSNSNEEQQTQRRELYDYLIEQLQQNNDE